MSRCAPVQLPNLRALARDLGWPEERIDEAAQLCGRMGSVVTEVTADVMVARKDEAGWRFFRDPWDRECLRRGEETHPARENGGVW